MPPSNKSKLVWILPVLLVALALLVRIPLLRVRETLLPGDEVMFGIMARDILNWHFPIYYYGQSYLGTLEAYVTALLSLGMGMSGWTVQIGAFFSYALFLVTHFFLIRRLFGLPASLFSSLLLVVAPPVVWELSVKAMGGYSEILFLGALSFLLWLKVFSDGKQAFALPLGVSVGAALWLNPLFAVYLLPLVLLTFYRGEGFSKRAKFLDPVRLALVRDYPIPSWARLLFWGVHVFVGIYVLKQFLVFFSGGWEARFLGFDFNSPPFQWKGVKKILLLLGAEGVLFAWVVSGLKGWSAFLKRWSPILLGFLVGYLPAIIYALAGGEGYRVLHKSGAIHGGELAGKLREVFLNLLPAKIWGLRFGRGDVSGRDLVGSLLILGLFVAAFLFYFYQYRRGWKSISQTKRGIQDAPFFFCLLTVSALGIPLVSSLAADRYLLPFYWVTAVVVGFFLSRLLSRSKVIPWILFLFLVGDYSLKAAEHVRRYPREQDIPGLIRILETEQLWGGATSYDNSYRLVFYSGGKLAFIPLEGMVRIARDTARVNGLEKKAVIFFKDVEYQKAFLKAHPKWTPQRVIRFGDYWIYVFGPSVRF